jgi:DNA mismatch endonuclease, patch repair protein
MRSIRARNTQPELSLRKGLWAAGVRGWRCHWRAAPGTPDLAWPGRKIAVFVDGAFWHGHPSRYKPGRSGPDWDAKIQRNMERDREVESLLRDRGWTVLRFWDFELRKDPEPAVTAIRAALHGPRS